MFTFLVVRMGKLSNWYRQKSGKYARDVGAAAYQSHLANGSRQLNEKKVIFHVSPFSNFHLHIVTPKLHFDFLHGTAIGLLSAIQLLTHTHVVTT